MLFYKLKSLINKEMIIDVNGTIRSDEALDAFDKLIIDIQKKITTSVINKIILDFKNLRLINSSGIGKLLLFNKSLEECNVQLEIKELSPSLYQIFRFARIENILTIQKKDYSICKKRLMK